MKKTLAEILGISVLTGITYKVGELFGKTLHNYLAYYMPIKMFGNYSWFNPEQYIKLYQQYSNGLDKTFGYIFGITFAGLFLASYVYVRFKK